LLSLVFRIPFFDEMLSHSANEGTQIIERPIYNLISFGGFILFTIGIGVLSGTKLFANVLIIFMLEIASLLKVRFTRSQKMVDFTLIIFGLIFALITIYGTKTYSWKQFFATAN
jgi:hypothetical protein